MTTSKKFGPIHPSRVPFLVVVRPAPSVAAAVFAVGCQNPLEETAALEAELAAKGVTGTVLLDLLLAQGNTVNRYFLGEFDGARFVSTRFEQAKARYEEFAGMSAGILRARFKDVDLSLLSSARQSAVRKGIAF